MFLCEWDNYRMLDPLAKQNGIVVPRPRGYLLMAEEEPVSEETIRELIAGEAVGIAEDLCRRGWLKSSQSAEYGSRIDRVLKRYLTIQTTDDQLCEEGIRQEYYGIRWGRIHGKKRKMLKWAIRKLEKRIRAEYATWNKYAGREDVLYIYSNFGGDKWRRYAGKDSIMSRPWFLDRVDKYSNPDYCDFYAKIRTKEGKHG